MLEQGDEFCRCMDRLNAGVFDSISGASVQVTFFFSICPHLRLVAVD
jgi:hypothetical protein